MSRLKHGRRASRRFLMLFAATAVALVVSLAGTHATTQATSGGSAYSIPLVGNMGDPDVTAVDTNPAANVVETTFVAEDATVDLGQGITAHALTFNGTIPGPTLRLNVGDTVIVRLVNNSSEATGIHWHGIELENSVDGTPFTQNQACSGCTYLYKFQVTRPGIYWYHPHHHSSTNQVFKGLYGMIIVTDPNEAALLPTGAHPTLPPLSATLPLVLSDITVCKAPGAWAPAEPTYPPNQPWVQNTNGGTTPTNLVQAGPTPRDPCKDTPIDKDGNSILPATWQNHDIPNIQKNGGGFEREGNVVLTNGRNVGGRGGYPQAPGAVSGTAELYNVASGQGLRLQLVNASAIRFMRLRLTTAAGALVNLVRVGGEGGLLDHAVVEGVAPGGFDTSINAGEILLPPGSRADVVAAIPAGLPVSSVLTLWTEDTNRTGMGFSNLPTVPVMHLNVTGPAGSPYTIAQGTQLREATGDLVPVLSGSAGFLNPNSFVPLKPLDPGPPPPAPWSFSNDIHLTAAGFLAGIDTIFGTHDLAGDYASAFHLASSRFARMGNTLDLSVTNTTNAHHPFHLHGFSMQPTSLTKASSPTFTWPYHEFRDNIDIPSGYTLHFKVKLEDRPLEDGVTMGGALGRWVFHCHIFFHATLGMLGEMVVLPTTGSASNGNEKPTVNTAGTWEFAAAGDIAERHGTYHDVDG